MSKDFDDFLNMNIAEQIAAAKGSHFGQIGTRQLFGLRCLEVKPIPDVKINGVPMRQNLIIFENAQGNRFQTRYSGKTRFEAEKVYTLKATIKDHTIVHNVNTTLLHKILIQ